MNGEIGMQITQCLDHDRILIWCVDEFLGLIDISILQSVIARRLSAQSTPQSHEKDDCMQYLGNEDEAWVNLQESTSFQVDRSCLVEENEIDFSLGGTLMITNDEGLNIWTPSSSWGSMNLDPMINTQLHGTNTNLLSLDESIPVMMEKMPMEEVFIGSTIPRLMSLNQGTCSLDIPPYVGDDL
jgi:hypothetical protein